MPPSSNVSSERVEGDFAKVQGTKWSSTGAIPCKSYKHLKPFGEMIQFDFRNRIFLFQMGWWKNQTTSWGWAWKNEPYELFPLKTRRFAPEKSM